MATTRTVLFLCTHGGAKSLIAASFFNRLAGEGWRAVALASDDPYESVPAPVSSFLASQGIDVSSFKPRLAGEDDLRDAALVVRVGTWDEVPMVSEDLTGAAAAIERRVQKMVAELARPSLSDLAGYFLRLGTFGFGGPIALAGAMQRDLVEDRQWVSEDEYKKGLALAQLAPGPLAAQLAIYLGWARGGILGATLIAFAFVLPSFLMVLAISFAYVRYGGLPWMQSAFYGIGAAVIAIIARSAWKLIRLTLSRDVLLWLIFAANAIATALMQAEIVTLILAGGVATLIARARPRVPAMCLAPAAFELFWFFAKAGAFVFGSGLAIVPFLYGGVVQRHGWLTEQQFLDAVAVAMITPGPVVITVAFIGYLVSGFSGAVIASIGVFLPCYLFVVIPAPYYARFADDPRLRAFVAGVTAGATGAIAGAVFVLAQRAIYDVPTLVIFAATVTALLIMKRVPEPVIIATAGLLTIFARS
jgi:chromate transporter